MQRAESNASFLSGASVGNKPSMKRSSSLGSICKTSKVSVGLTNSFVKLSTLLSPKKKDRLFGTLEEESYICGQVHANNSQDVDTEEAGDWHYLVIDPLGIRPREDALYTKQSKKSASNRLKEGSVCAVDRRRVVGWTMWLRLKDGGGWVFDISPKDKRARLVEVEVETGSWCYECVADDTHILTKPWLSSLWHAFLNNEEVVQVKERVRPVNAKGCFLRLADGRGWVVDFVDGQQALLQQSEGAAA